MNDSGRKRRNGWLWALPMAWASSALLLVDETRLLYAVACLAWLALAWRCTPPKRLVVARRAISFLLALALPLQGFAMVALDARGAAHVHTHASSAGHWHGEVRHHHHAAGDAILVDDAMRERQHSLGTAEDKRIAFGAADSIAPSQRALPAFVRSHVPPAERTANPPSHIASALEPPPRLPSASR